MENVMPFIALMLAAPQASAAFELSRFPDRQSCIACVAIAESWKRGCEQRAKYSLNPRERDAWGAAVEDANIRLWTWRHLLWTHEIQAGESLWCNPDGTITRSAWPCLVRLNEWLSSPPGRGQSAWLLGELPWPTP